MGPRTCGACEISSKPTYAPATTKRTTTKKPVELEAKCIDRTPKFCETQKRLCNFKKYEKTMKYKCGKTCGFCSGAPVVVEKVVPTQSPTTNAQFGPCHNGQSVRPRRQSTKSENVWYHRVPSDNFIMCKNVNRKKIY